MEDLLKESILKSMRDFKSTYKIYEGERKDENKSFQTNDSYKKNQKNFNSYLNEEKSKSDEELESDLLEAVKSYLKNEPKNKKAPVKTDSKTRQPDYSKYVSQGAIPKNFTKKISDDSKKNSKKKKNKVLPTFKSLPPNQHSPKPVMSIDLNFPNTDLATKNYNSFQGSENDRIHTVKKKNEVKPLLIKNPLEPFLYVVPSNPCPFFTLPSGNYFVTTDGSNLPPISSIISHPEISAGDVDYLTNNNNNNETLDENINNRYKSNNLGQSKNFFSNNFNLFENLEENNEDKNDDGKVNEENFKIMKKLEEIQGDLFLEEKFDKTGMPIEDLKLFLKAKINAFNEVLENLNLLKITEKIDPDLFSKNTFYDKQYVKLTNNFKKDEIVEDQFFTLTQLFPTSDHQNLRQELAECDGKEDSFLKLVKKKLDKADRENELDPGFKLLLSHFPNYDLDILYYKWSECLGSEEKLKKFIDEEKKIVDMQQIILTELPELSLIEAKKKAENFLNDESALENFLAEQQLTKKIEEQFSKICAILPEHDPVELMAKCQEFQGDEGLVDEYILCVQTRMIKEAQFLNMQSILPNADPDFLKEKIEEAQGDDNAINVLTNSLLENDDYPKVEIDSRITENRKLWQTYVDEFDVKDFLLEIGSEKDLDFKDENEELVLEFFQTRYPGKFDNTECINNLFENLKNFDMLQLCKDLDKKVEYVELPFSNFKNSKFTKNFLQKVVFIEKRKEIELYLGVLKNQKMTEKLLAGEHNAFLQCPLCYEDEVVESDATACSEGHVYCRNCVKQYISVKVGDGIYKFQCISETCNGFFTSKVLTEILPKAVLQKISFKEGAEEISKANVQGLEFCTACDFAYIPLPEDKIFFCQNPDCLKEICRKCKEDNHIPLRCEEIERPKDLEARKKIEETMSEKLIRSCPKCGKKFIKQDGCNKMTCVCGSFMCYICSKIIDGYSHFSNNGGYCPLYSNNEVLHGADVINAGIAARDEILQEDPNIRLFYDPAKEK